MALCSHHHPGDAMPQREVPLTLIIFAVMYRFYFQLDPCSAGSASAAEGEQSSRDEPRVGIIVLVRNQLPFVKACTGFPEKKKVL